METPASPRSASTATQAGFSGAVRSGPGRPVEAGNPAVHSRAIGRKSALFEKRARTPPEIWAGTIGKWEQVTHLNTGVNPAWGETRNVHWMNSSMRVQGWLTFPKDFTPGKTYPLVVNVHGGPSHACPSPR